MALFQSISAMALAMDHSWDGFGSQECSGTSSNLSIVVWNGQVTSFLLCWTSFPCSTVFYGQYKCFGPGANQANRAAWSHELTDAQAASFMSLGYIDGSLWVTEE